MRRVALQVLRQPEVGRTLYSSARSYTSFPLHESGEIIHTEF